MRCIGPAASGDVAAVSISRTLADIGSAIVRPFVGVRDCYASSLAFHHEACALARFALKSRNRKRRCSRTCSE
jgi:hypothetical protein